jgi:hypothetical protein
MSKRSLGLLLLLGVWIGAGGVAHAAAGITVTPTGPLDFMHVDVTTTSTTTLTVTATNSGTSSLMITSATVANPHTQDYAVTGNTGNQTVGAGNSVHWDIQCTPQTRGLVDGTFQIVSNAPTSPSNITLKCTGDQGALSVDTTTFDFQATLVGSTKTKNIVLSNSGNVAVSGIAGAFDDPAIGYSIDPLTVVPDTLNPNDTVTLAIRFQPTKSTDGGAASLAFNGTWHGHGTVPVATTLAGQAVSLTLSATPLGFGSFRFDTAPTQTFHIANGSTAAIPIQSLNLTAPDGMTVAGDLPVTIKNGSAPVTLPASIPAGQQFDVTVTARPSNRTGPVGGTFVVHSSLAGLVDQNVVVTGNAIAAGLSATPMLDFTAVDVDLAVTAPPKLTATITNTDTTASLDVSAVTIMSTSGTGAAFTFTSPLPAAPTLLGPGTSLAIEVTYKPTVERASTDTPDKIVLGAMITGVLNGPVAQTIAIQGHGIDRHLAVDTPTFPSAFRNPGNAAPIRSVIVHNTGDAVLKVTAVTLSGDPVWQLVDGGATDIPGRGMYQVMVKFSPTEIGPASAGQLTLMTNDNLNPVKTVALSGAGVPRNVAFGPDPAAQIDVGATGSGIPITAKDILAVANLDPDVGFTIHGIQLSGDPVFRVEETPADVALLASETKRFSITFSPAAVGDFHTTATLLLDQDPKSHADVEIVGHAVFVDAHGSGGCDAGGAGHGGGLILGLAALGVLRRRRRRARAIAGGPAVAAALAVAALGPAARADGIDIAVFEPTPATTGTGFQLQSPEVGADGSWVVSSIASYASRPLVLDAVGTDGARQSSDALVKNSARLQLGVAYAFLDRFEAGAHLPIYSQDGDPMGDPKAGFTQPPANGTAIGNLTLHGKVRLWHGGLGPGALALGVGASAVIPTATKGQFTGSDKPEGRLLVLGSFTPAALASRLTVSTNAGAVVRGKTEYANIAQQSAVAWGLGASYRVLDDLWATAELFGEATPSGRSQRATASAMPPAMLLSPVEWLAGVSFKADRRFTIGVAVGRGVTDAIGTPSVRGMLSLALVPGAAAIAPLHGLAAGPDGDADGDGIPDSIDKCPNEPEDIDMFEDTDGCPDPDNDHDGIPDALDKCPLDPEDKDGFQDADGCPDKDNDGDGIPDSIDKCPNEPEDKDGFEDLDGCPDPDNDHDGIPDEKDKCPNEPETINGFQDEDGCPDKGDSTIVLSPDRIETIDPIQFAALKLTRASQPVLAQVAATLRAHIEIVRLRITVHVQPTADSDADQARSEKRAQAIREWLVQWGIAPARLEVRGFGGAKPVMAPDQRGAAKLNDRVELIILERK